MENILFEKEVIKHLNLPSIPKKEHDGVATFTKAVAVVELRGERYAYAVCRFDRDRGDVKPVVVKTFGIEPFVGIKRIFVVPNYMTNIEDIKDMDLDEESKKKAKQMLEEAKELENEGTEDEDPMSKLPEYIFPEIENKEQAIAWLKNYNYRNKIKKGKIPTTDENIKLRLYSIYTELQKKTK